MKIALQKMHISILMFEYKYAGLTANATAQQSALEKMVMLHTQMRVEKEQTANKLLFNNL